MDSQIAHKLMRHFTSASTATDTVEPLSDRELEVLEMVASGASNRSIGRALDISKRTVQGHIANIFEKLASAPGKVAAS